MRMADGSSTLPLRGVVRLPDTNNAFASMPAIDGSGSDSSIGAKVITVFPGNEATPYDDTGRDGASESAGKVPATPLRTPMWCVQSQAHVLRF